MIGELATAIANCLTGKQLMYAMRAHPTFNEAVSEAVESKDNAGFESIFESAVNMLKETEELTNKAEEEEMKYELSTYKLGDLLKDLTENCDVNILWKAKISGGFITMTGKVKVEYYPIDKVVKAYNERIKMI